MPYINKEERRVFDKSISDLAGAISTLYVLKKGLSGGLNYTITRLLYLTLLKEGLSYDRINTALGVLESVKQELYRRVASDYEDSKKDENGDVY